MSYEDETEKINVKTLSKPRPFKKLGLTILLYAYRGKEQKTQFSFFYCKHSKKVVDYLQIAKKLKQGPMKRINQEWTSTTVYEHLPLLFYCAKHKINSKYCRKLNRWEELCFVH